MNKKERIIGILEKIPKQILINCAEQVFKKEKNPLELELERLSKLLINPDLDDLDLVMKKIREIKNKLKHASSDTIGKTPGILIIPGAKYYESGGIKLFSIDIKKSIYHDFQAILKNNSLFRLDLILVYLGDTKPEETNLYQEDAYAEEHVNFIFTDEYKALKNKKLIRIRDLIKDKNKDKSGDTGHTTGEKSNCITRSKVPLRDYQIKAIQFINNPSQKSLLVVHGTGTGKTLTALTATQCYLDSFPKDKVLVISPASLTGNFAKEMIKYGGKLSTQYNFYSFTKFTSLNKGTNKTPFDMYYEDEIEAFRDLHQDDTSDEIRYAMSKYFNEEVKNSNDFEDYKQRANEINFKNQYDCRNTMVIIDEAHNLRNMGAGYDAVFKCVAQSKKLLLLTATPFVNSLHDFVPIINLLYRDENILKKGSRNKVPLRIPSEAKYMAALEAIYDHVKGKVTFLNEKNPDFFPAVKMIKKEVNMTPAFFKQYEKALISDRSFGDAPEVFYNGWRRGVNAVGAEEYLNQKLDVVLELVREGRQTLVFTNWIDAGVNILKQAFDENDIMYLIISGEVLASTRLEIVEKFNNKRVQVLIITLAGSEGLDLKEVRDVIILDPVWNPAVMEQIIGRAVRYRSHINLPLDERKVDVYNIILKTPPDADIPSGDELLYAFIHEKQKQLNDVNKMLKNASI